MKFLKLTLMIIVVTFVTNGQVNNKILKNATVTAYCIKGSKMANGKYPKEGVVAADIKYYKFGETIFLNGNPFVVSDTGGNIKGRGRFDIYLTSCSNAKRFGRRTMSLKK